MWGDEEVNRQEQGRAGGSRKEFTVAQMLTGLPLRLDLLLA